jgi:hypothetical protein
MEIVAPSTCSATCSALNCKPTNSPFDHTQQWSVRNTFPNKLDGFYSNFVKKTICGRYKEIMRSSRLSQNDKPAYVTSNVNVIQILALRMQACRSTLRYCESLEIQPRGTPTTEPICGYEVDLEESTVDLSFNLAVDPDETDDPEKRDDHERDD